MIKFNLNKVMDDKGLSIQDVYERTGISRNTISQLYNGKSKGIQLSTLNKLVNFLNLESVSDLFVDVVDYENVNATVELRGKLIDNHTKKDLNEIFSLSSKLTDKDDFFEISFFSLSFFDGENRIVSLPLFISEQSTNIFFQLESRFDLVNDDNLAYNYDFKFSNLLNNIGENNMECVIARAFSRFMLRQKRSLPDSLEYIGFRTDLGSTQKDVYSISLLWSVDDLADKTKIRSLLNMKYG